MPPEAKMDLIYRCHCDGHHYVDIQAWAWSDDTGDTYLSVVDSWRASSIKDRVKAAWKLLRGVEHVPTEVQLTNDQVRDIGLKLTRWSFEQEMREQERKVDVDPAD